MRKRIVAGNWKMNMNDADGAALAEALVDGTAGKTAPCEIVIFPPFTAIAAVARALEGSAIALGGQDLFYEDAGAFTGEVSGPMLRSLGCSYVLVGHSERRHIIGEGGDLLARKVRAALRTGLTPVFCVGELLDEREGGRAAEVVATEMREGLAELGKEEITRAVLAYEPVWAIGTGKTATPQDASEMHAVIREVLQRMFNEEVAESVPILYGGSVKPDNAARLMGVPGVDGVLVGGASLEAPSFIDIIFAS
jgi:triosephosphate isomerase